MGITIKEPCSEDWSKMTSTEKGAFCQKCAKEVIDFTSKSPNQIKSILADQIIDGKNTCGRITNIQMDRVNDSFINWKSDQESFRAVWTFSLVAIFGLGLFSCQNTASKEIVSQMNENSAQMLYQDSIANATAEVVVDTSNISESKDSAGVVNISELIGGTIPAELHWPPEYEISGPIAPWDISTIINFPTDIMGNFYIEPDEIQTCIVSMGDMVIDGAFSIPLNSQAQLLAEKEAELRKISSSFIDTPPTNTPPLPDNKPTVDARLIAISTDGDKDFRAYISPNPIEVSSKLYLLLHELSDINIKIHLAGLSKAIRSGSVSLSEGKHEVDLKLFKFEQGDYDMHVVVNNMKRILKFKVT